MTEEKKQLIREKGELTNRIMNYFLSKGIKADLSLDGLDDEKEYLNIQINLHPKGLNDFAFFYDFEDDDVSFCSIFEFLTPITLESFETYQTEFENNKQIFQDLLPLTSDVERGIINETHAYTKVTTKDITDSFLDEIYNFFMNKNEFFTNLVLVSEKFNFDKYNKEEGDLKQDER